MQQYAKQCNSPINALWTKNMLFLALQLDKAPEAPQRQVVDATSRIHILAYPHGQKFPSISICLTLDRNLCVGIISLSVPTAPDTNTKCTSCFSLQKLYRIIDRNHGCVFVRGIRGPEEPCSNINRETIP